MDTDTDGSTLVVPDLQSGMSYLNRLPLANPALAEQQLMQFLDALLAHPPDPSDLLPLIEQTRVPMSFVEEEMALRYHGKPLPLPDAEEKAFQQVVEAWQKMARVYAICAERDEPEAGTPAYASRIATILHRCIHYTGMVILEHYRARRELPAGVWIDLHGYYATAEEWGVATTPVPDPLNPDQQTTHCTAAYVALLLIDIASPYAQTVRDLSLIRRWAGMWAPLVSLAPVSDDAELPPFVVELMRDGGMRPAPFNEEPGADTRRLDTARLGMQINHVLTQLRQRIPPAQLQLGEETNAHVTRLLTQLSKPWTQTAAPRKFRRFAASGTARVAVGFEAMHFYLSGTEFVQPDAAKTYSRSQFDTLFTFRHMTDPTAKLTIQKPADYPTDQWEVINHSANGFRLARSAVGQKMNHGQMLAVCPHDGERFLLAQVSWLMQENTGGLVTGVAVLPGVPAPVGVRLADLARGGTNRYVRAFMLSPVPAVGVEGSLVLPLGLYQASHVLDVAADDAVWQVKMKHIVQRGGDFERISFERV